MGGLGPGIGGSEILVIGLVALLVVGPKDLPLLMRRVGQVVAKARSMANEFRASFDEMARQSELDDLRKEVEALRRGQGMHPLGDEAAAAFKDINQSLNAPVSQTTALPVAEPAALPAPTVETAEATPAPAAKPKRKRAAPKAKADVTPKPVVTAKVAARRAAAINPAETAAPRKAPAPRKPAAAKKPAAPRKRTPKS